MAGVPKPGDPEQHTIGSDSNPIKVKPKSKKKKNKFGVTAPRQPLTGSFSYSQFILFDHKTGSHLFILVVVNIIIYFTFLSNLLFLLTFLLLFNCRLREVSKQPPRHS